tara:strand:+ start:6384 stop:7055 length:672 start_codon:yes stop_codon:yes gene_type:complete
MKYLSVKEMGKVDKVAVKKFKIRIEQMMELAGKSLADFVYCKLKPKKVLILYGKGNNGAGGLVAAKHLINRGVKVSIVKASRRGNGIVRARLKTLRRIGVLEKNNVEKTDVIIDALLGYGMKGKATGRYAELIDQANSMKSKGTKIVSLDLPSGVDPDTGESSGNFIRADSTLTLALPKLGMKDSKRGIGSLYLVDIGIPKQVYDYLEIKYEDLFEKESVVRI